MGPETRTVDGFLGGRLMLRQLASGHRSGTDAILLAAAVEENTTGELIDLGAGVGAAGLAAALRCHGISASLVEIDPNLIALARENIDANSLAARARAVACDALAAEDRRRAGLRDGMAGTVIANPPWLREGRSRVSPDQARARAHVAGGEGRSGLEAWLRAMAALTRPGGTMLLIHRADAIGDILACCEGRFGDLAILPVYPREGDAAIRVLVRGMKGRRAPTRILPGLTLHEADGRFTPRADAIHRGDAAIDMAAH